MEGNLLKDFLIELCKYYMEFLETDFKDNRPPSRKISLYNKDGILTDIGLAKYPKLPQHSLRLFSDNFQNNPFTNIGKGDFVIEFPEEILRQIRNLQNNPLPFEKKPPEQIILDFLKKQKLPNKDNVIKDIQDNIKNGKVKDLASYLSKYVIVDFYDELYDLWKNKQVVDKQDFYLYFLDIKYENIVYPIFYIPVSIERTNDGKFNFEFDPVFLINKKAIQYVSKKVADEQNKDWRIDLPPRHLYLSGFEGKGELLKHLQGILNEICNFFALKPFQINTAAPIDVKTDNVRLTNNCYLSIFDKSDEALLNDYEELLNLALSGEEAKALEIFSKLSTDYLFENPVTFEREVEREYDSQSVSEKLAYNSPIPLNKEQLQVLRSLDKKDCERIIIEGPPGTGKSHTITAIINNALLSKKSVLMVSDKKEALDVVEEKINDVLDKMKLDDFIQNPIVRLGKKENTFAGIFKQINYDKIKNRFNTYKRHKDQIEKEIDNVIGNIKRDVNNEIEVSLSLNPDGINHLLAYEETFNALWHDLLDLDELEEVEGSSESLLKLWKAASQFHKDYAYLFQKYRIDFCASISAVSELKTFAESLGRHIKALHRKIIDRYPSLSLSKEMSKDNLLFLEDCLKRLEDIRKPIIGYLFCGKKIKSLDSQFKERFFMSGIESIRNHKDKLSDELQLYKHCQKLNESWANVGLNLFLILKDNSCEDISKRLQQLISAIDNILSVNEKLPVTCSKIGLNISDINSIFSNKYIQFQEDDIAELQRYLNTYFVVRAGSTKLLHGSYIEDRKILENRLVFKMTNILDESVVNFRDNYRGDAEDLRKIIRAKKRIPKELLKKLVDAFPCLIVSIRELGEFIPLEPNIFDIVIIDEASQVSIAQAFPAILRAKKVVVLGDAKQYSNVKSHNASVAVNNFLFNRVKDAFNRSILPLSDREQERVKDKVVNFNIKNSILDFMRNITNYQCSLKKHFRGYIEIIGYSNETFYQNALQVMKIRGKSIKDVIQFHPVKANDGQERFKNTNQAEVDFILSELQRLKEEGFKGTVGIITPFTNQQKLITNQVYDSESWQFYQNEFKLKIMTFDSCQGDEKDIVYYSMVEKPNEDILKYIFPIKLTNLDEEEDGNLKAQRLNVGFSRAKESIRFVMSKNPEDVRGEAGKALQFYKRNLEKPDDIEIFKKMDPKSKMEPVLFNLVTQTPFYIANKDRIEIITQFDIGKYIKQLNPLAQIPQYRSDFLFIYRDDSGKTHMVILEYDGFEYHFKDTGFINETNFDRFYIEEDIERRKTIESYGYPFIRLNKFLLRDDPIAFLNENLERHCKKKL